MSVILSKPTCDFATECQQPEPATVLALFDALDVAMAFGGVVSNYALTDFALPKVSCLELGIPLKYSEPPSTPTSPSFAVSTLSMPWVPAGLTTLQALFEGTPAFSQSGLFPNAYALLAAHIAAIGKRPAVPVIPPCPQGAYAGPEVYIADGYGAANTAWGLIFPQMAPPVAA